MNFESIPEGIKKRAEECKSTEELLALAKEEGIELSEEDLEAIDGGLFWTTADNCKLCIDLK